MAKKTKKRRGHYCWSCQRVLPNEQFSGRGHKRHLCRACSKLGQEELEYRQAVKDIERCLGWDGRVRRRQRKAFERFRRHPNERVRGYVEDLEARWVKEGQEWRERLRQEDEALEALAGEYPEDEEPVPEPSPYDDSQGDEIPF